MEILKDEQRKEIERLLYHVVLTGDIRCLNRELEYGQLDGDIVEKKENVPWCEWRLDLTSLNDAIVQHYEGDEVVMLMRALEVEEKEYRDIAAKMLSMVSGQEVQGITFSEEKKQSQNGVVDVDVVKDQLGEKDGKLLELIVDWVKWSWGWVNECKKETENCEGIGKKERVEDFFKRIEETRLPLFKKTFRREDREKEGGLAHFNFKEQLEVDPEGGEFNEFDGLDGNNGRTH